MMRNRGGIRPLRRPRRGLVVVAAIATALLLLAGCADIPNGGGVSKVLIDAAGGDPALVTQPDEPVKNATQEEILQGFIRAGRGPQGNYLVARDFLTDGFSAKWNPNAGVLISSSPVDSTPAGTDTLQILVSVSAELDAAGRYTTYSTPQTKPLIFQFQKDKQGQWRISSAPDGTVLTPNRFSSIFQSYDLYFFDPSFQYLVPDERWFADSRSISTLIVKGLLAGPTDWLANGVLLSAFPTGTELNGTPTVTNGKITVDLSSQVSSESGSAQLRMTQQLTQSLNTLGTINSASITVGGFPLSIGDGPVPDQRETVLPDPVGFEKGAFGSLVDGAVRPLSGVGTAIDKLEPIAAAVARNGTDVAALSAGGVSIVRGTAAAVVLDRRPDLIAPSLDAEGFVWTVPADQPGAIMAFDTSGKPHPVAFAYDGTVISLDVSRDGTRVLIALATASGPKLLIAGVNRDKDLVPTSLGPPIYPAIGSGDLIDASWVDSGSIVVLSHDGATTAIDRYPLGGPKQSLGTLQNGMRVVGGNGADGIRVLDTSGAVFSPSGSVGWQDTGLHASFLASQQ
jgi:hypothetical protein